MAGLSRGSYSPPSGVNLPSAAAAVIAKVAAVRHADSSEYFMDLGNQWSRLKDKYSGDFKSYYVDIPSTMLREHSPPTHPTPSPSAGSVQSKVSGALWYTTRRHTSLTIRGISIRLVTGAASNIKMAHLCIGRIVLTRNSPYFYSRWIILRLIVISPSKGVYLFLFFHAFEFLMYLSWIPTPAQKGSESSTAFNFNRA